MTGEHDTVVVDIEPATSLPLEALYAELAELRARLAGVAEDADRDGDAAERRGSAFWYASWKNGNRQRTELLLELERHKQMCERLKQMCSSAAREVDRVADVHVVALAERDARIAELATDLDRAEASGDALMMIARAAVRALRAGAGERELAALAEAVGLEVAHG